MFPFTKKSYLHHAQWRYYFYLSRVRILVSPWLLTWLANYKRASRSGARPVLLKFSFTKWLRGAVTGDSLDELPNFHIDTFSELEEHSGRFAEVSESDVEKFIEGEENVNTKKRPFRRAPRNQRNREDSSNWIRQLLEPVCFSCKEKDWEILWTVISPRNFG